MIDSAPRIHPCGQSLDPQVEGHHLLTLGRFFWLLSHKGSVVVASCIAANGHFLEMRRRGFGKVSMNGGELFHAMLATAACRKKKQTLLNFEVHRRIAERE